MGSDGLYPAAVTRSHTMVPFGFLIYYDKYAQVKFILILNYSCVVGELCP
jgi:hypothetical protein